MLRHCEISPRLRAHGHHAARGPAKSIIDRSHDKVLLAAEAEREAAQLAAARQELLTLGAVRLSEIGPFDKLQFALFLDLLGEDSQQGPIDRRGASDLK